MKVRAVILAAGKTATGFRVPPEVVTALDAEPAVRACFDGLSFSNQRSYLLWVEGTKNPETRAGRVGQGVELLRAGQTHR